MKEERGYKATNGLLNASKVTNKASQLIAQAEWVSELHSKADVMDEQIGVELEPFIVRLGSPETCTSGRWDYDGIENGYVHLKHTCDSRHDNLVTRVKLVELLQKAAVE